MYDLYGIIVHQGQSRQFGHYYAYCRGFEHENVWYKCNDESITRLQGGIDSVMGKQAYLLFYQLVPSDSSQRAETVPIPKELAAPQSESRQHARDTASSNQNQSGGGTNSQQSTACTSSDKKSPQNGLFESINNMDKKMSQIIFKSPSLIEGSKSKPEKADVNM